MAKHKQIEGQLSFADFLIAGAQAPAEEQSADEMSKEQRVPEEPAAAAEMPLSDEDMQFEAEFARLSALFESVRTDTFDAMQFLSPIANAVKTALEEEIPFADALKGHCSKQSAERIAAAFGPDQEKELFAIISGMHDEI